MFSCLRVALSNVSLRAAAAFGARLSAVPSFVLRGCGPTSTISTALALLVQRLVLVPPSALGSRLFSSVGCQRAELLQQSTVVRVQRAASLASAACAGPSQSSWGFALRAGVLRRAVSLSRRPVRHACAIRATAGRQDKCPSKAAASLQPTKHPSGAGLSRSPLPLASATKPRPNTALNRNANDGRLLRAPARSSAPFGVRLALR